MKPVLRLLQHLVLYPLGFLLPRDSSCWVFGAPEGKFEGNSKFLYLWTSQHAPDVEAWWISPNRELVRVLKAHGLKAAHRRSVAGVMATLRAKFMFVNSNGDDVNFPLSGGARIFNLWHGVGIKNILRKSTVGLNAKIFHNRWFFPLYIYSLQRFKRPYYVLSTSKTMSTHFAQCFDVPEARCLQLGYPRQDPAFDAPFRRYCMTLEDGRALEGYRSQYRRIFVYAPTLRQKATDLMSEAFPDLERLSDVLEAKDALLLVKLHPRDHTSVDALCRPFNNIKPWPDGCEFYTHVSELDCLITDYSSLLYDWIGSKDQGVLLYPYDIARYIAQERDLAFPYNENIIGPRAESFSELCDLILSGAPFERLPQDQLEALKGRFWGPSSGKHASQAIVEFVRGQS